jgi:hypothetical protein
MTMNICLGGFCFASAFSADHGRAPLGFIEQQQAGLESAGFAFTTAF